MSTIHDPRTMSSDIEVISPASLDVTPTADGGEQQDKEESLGFKLHGISRAPFFLALTSLFSPYLLHLARLAASPDDGRVSWFGIRILPTSYVGLYSTAAALIAASKLLSTMSAELRFDKTLSCDSSSSGSWCHNRLFSQSKALLEACEQRWCNDCLPIVGRSRVDVAAWRSHCDSLADHVREFPCAHIRVPS